MAHAHPDVLFHVTHIHYDFVFRGVQGFTVTPGAETCGTVPGKCSYTVVQKVRLRPLNVLASNNAAANKSRLSHVSRWLLFWMMFHQTASCLATLHEMVLGTLLVHVCRCQLRRASFIPNASVLSPVAPQASAGFVWKLWAHADGNSRGEAARVCVSGV